jgi:hypothetical protein
VLFRSHKKSKSTSKRVASTRAVALHLAPPPAADLSAMSDAELIKYTLRVYNGLQRIWRAELTEFPTPNWPNLEEAARQMSLLEQALEQMGCA